MSEEYVAYLMAEHPAVLISNALARAGGVENVILAGLNDIQKSYLRLPEDSKIIDIQGLSDVEAKLASIAPPLDGQLRCTDSNHVKGLFIAQKLRKSLIIDENAAALPDLVARGEGIIIVENVSDASPVISVNYANALNASLMVVDSLTKHEGRDVQRWIQEWKEKDDDRQYQKLKQSVRQRIGEMSFAEFQYATFFTEGIPYGLVLENAIPMSHVHLSLRPDLFIVNNILFDRRWHVGAAVLFSPVFFEDEETNWLSDFFISNRYFLRSLIGRQATLANFDFTAQYFPYDLLHICSHGGEVDGYEMSEQFTDRDGKVHLVEFEEVIGVMPVPGKPDMVTVQRKVLPRKLDGFDWMSPQLDEQHIASHVILDMWKCMMESRGTRAKKDRIAMSCAIACVDSIHQGQFDTVALYRSPIIFNNTCWSWNEVAAFFLACGARGYIGTLWAIDNLAAVAAAKEFYERLFGGSVLEAFHKAVKAIDGTESKDIYIYWGLHFSTLAPGNDFERSRSKVGKELTSAAGLWLRKIEATRNTEIRTNLIKVLRLIFRELLSNFRFPEVFRLYSEARRRIPEFTQPRAARDLGEVEPTKNQPSMDLPIEYKEAKKQD